MGDRLCKELRPRDVSDTKHVSVHRPHNSTTVSGIQYLCSVQEEAAVLKAATNLSASSAEKRCRLAESWFYRGLAVAASRMI